MPPKKTTTTSNKPAPKKIANIVSKKPTPKKKPVTKAVQTSNATNNNNKAKAAPAAKIDQNAPKRRGRKPGSKNKPKAETVDGVVVAAAEMKQVKKAKAIKKQLEDHFNNNNTSPAIQALLDDDTLAPGEGQQQLLKMHQILMSVPDVRKLFAFAISPGSLKSYLGYKKMVTSRRSFRTKQNFTFTTDSLADFILDPFVSDDIATSSCESIVSAFKFLYKLDYCMSIPKSDETKLDFALAARKHLVPDHSRVTGAVTRVRTLQFLDFVDKQADLNEQEKQQYKDLAITLYAGCLRVFQSRTLTLASFHEDINNKGTYWIAVPRKGNQKELEHKILDKQLGARLMEVVNRRAIGKNREDLLFEDITKTVENNFAKLCEKASIELEWPSGMHFKGTHMFRHGAVQDAAVEDGLEFAQTRSGHESDKCLRHYARSDTQRKLAIEKRKTKNREIESYTSKLLEAAQAKFQLSAQQHSIDLVEQRPLGRDVIALAEKDYQARMAKLHVLVAADRSTFGAVVFANDEEEEVVLAEDGTILEDTDNAVLGTINNFTDMPAPEQKASSENLRQEMCAIFNNFQQNVVSLINNNLKPPRSTSICKKCTRWKAKYLRIRRINQKRRLLIEELKISNRVSLREKQAAINRLKWRLKKSKAAKPKPKMRMNKREALQDRISKLL